jgi:hypothetical protein
MSDTWKWVEILFRTRSVTFIAQTVILCSNCLFRNGWNLYCSNLQIMLVLPITMCFGPSNLVQKKVMLATMRKTMFQQSHLPYERPPVWKNS